MAQLQTLVVTDRQTPTPANFTLTPDGEKGGVGILAKADSSGIAISKKRLSLERRPNGSRIRFVERWQFPVMVTETINGVSIPRVARVAYVDITWNFQDTHLEQERNDVVGMVMSAHETGKLFMHDTIVKDTAVY